MANLDEVDQQIADWQRKLAAARENVLELYDHPTYKMLDGRTEPLTGATAAQVTPALAAMNELFGQIGLLSDVVDKAVRIRQAAGRFTWSDRPAREIQALLQGPSIQLPPIATPLAQRGLLTSAEQAQSVTPEQMLAAMIQAFANAKSAVLAVDSAWSRLNTMLTACETKLATLSAVAKTLGDDAAAAVAITQQQLDALKANAVNDPLSAVRLSSQPMTDSLERLRVRVDALSKERAGLHHRVEQAGSVIAEIAAGRTRADAAAARCRQCIDNPTGLLGSISDKQLAELTEWLSTLKECERQGRWTALAMGLDRWEQLAAEYTAVQTAAVTANEGMIELLAELKGRFSALKIKARTRGAGGGPGLAQAERLAAEALSRPLVPLDQANKLVVDYEKRLSEL